MLLPLSPTQILWINLVATVALALPLAFEAKEPDVMRRRPPPDARAGQLLLVRTALVALLMTAARWAFSSGNTPRNWPKESAPSVALAESQTIAVTAIIIFQCFYLANCRSLRYSFLAVGDFTNRMFYAGVALVLILQAAFIYLPPANALFGSAPLNFEAWTKASLVGALILPAMMVEKRLIRPCHPGTSEPFKTLSRDLQTALEASAGSRSHRKKR